MAVPTVEEAIDMAAYLLGDEPKRRFTSASLVKAVGLAFNELIDNMVHSGLDTVELHTFYTVPAGVSILTPATAGISNFGSLVRLRERPGGSTAETQFTFMSPVQILPPVTGGGANFGLYHYYDNKFEFQASEAAVELEITYYRSAALPDFGSLGIDNCLTVVAKLAASIAGPTKGLAQLGAKYRSEVMMPGGAMELLISPILRSQQSEHVQRGAYSAGQRAGVGWYPNYQA